MGYDTNSTNFATNHRWIASVPFSVLFKDETDVKLNLIQFDIPDTNMGTTEVAYQGYNIERPTGVIQPDEKNVTFSYILDSNLKAYWLLYKWMGMFTKEILPVVNGQEDDAFVEVNDKIMTIKVVILDEWKKPTFEITYYDCWIKSFGPLSMSYQDDPEPLNHEFTVVYSRFEVNDIVTS